MKIQSCLITLALAVWPLLSQATLFSSSGSLLIPDGNSAGVESSITSSGFASGSNVGNLLVNLTISGGRNGDLYVYLTHDNVTAVLLNRVGRGEPNTVGGYADAGFLVTLQDGSPDIHTYGQSTYSTSGSGQVMGTFSADGRTVSPFDVMTSSSRDSNPFSVFSGTPANGSWNLSLADVNGNGQQSTLDSWSLEITAVPEPINVALGIFAATFVLGQGLRVWRGQRRSRV